MPRTLLSSLVAFSLLFACTAEEKPTPADKPPTDTTAPDTGSGDAGDNKVAFTLAKADAMDGTTDKVVHKCAGCALGMDGKADHAFELEGYTMHFCSGPCRDGFQDGAADKVLALKVD